MQIKTGLLFQQILMARDKIRSDITPTPIVKSNDLKTVTGDSVFFKLENLQKTGSFKVRGATNSVLSLSKDQLKRGIIGFSTGNHGLALAYVARVAKIKCVICMSSLVPQEKVKKIKDEGAEVIIFGDSQDEAESNMKHIIQKNKLTFIHPFDQKDIISGQGTLGLEIADALPKVSNVLVPVSGGGLISGIAIALKENCPNVKIIGVSMEKGAAMYESQRKGEPVRVKEVPTLADSLGGGIGLKNMFTFKLFRSLVDDFILVSEEEIIEAIRYAYLYTGQTIEGSAAVGLAAILAGKFRFSGDTLALLTGNNIDKELHSRITLGQQKSET